MKGKIITLEGGDGAGKETQTKLLQERLENDGYKVKRMSFPRYDKFWGLLIREHLDGLHGGLTDINPYFFGSLYAFDRMGAIEDINEALEEGMIVLNDRYVEANFIHQGAKYEGERRRSLVDFFWNYEHNLLKIPQSDLVIFMDLDPEWAAKAMQAQGRSLDINESDLEYQIRVRETGLELSKIYGWQVVNCLNSIGTERLSREELSDTIYSTVKHYLTGK